MFSQSELDTLTRTVIVPKANAMARTHIFIDEAGTFTGAQNQHNIFVVGALIIPDGHLAKVEKKYRVLSSDLPQEQGEVKGRLLSERPADQILSHDRR